MACILNHYSNDIMGAIGSQIISLTIVYSAVYSGSNQRKHQSSALLAFARGIHPWPVNSPHKWPVTRKMLPFDDVIMSCYCLSRRDKKSRFCRWRSRWVFPLSHTSRTSWGLDVWQRASPHIVTDVLMISIFSFYTVEFRYNAINFLQIAQY